MTPKHYFLTSLFIGLIVGSVSAQTQKVSLELDFTFSRMLNKTPDEAVADFQKALDPGRQWLFVKKSKAFANEQDKIKQVKEGAGFTDHLEKFNSDAGHGTIADAFSVGSDSESVEPFMEVTGGQKGNYCQMGVIAYALKANGAAIQASALKDAEVGLVAAERPSGFILKQFVDGQGLKTKPFAQLFSTTDALERIKANKLKYVLTVSKLSSNDKNNVTFVRDPFSYNPALTKVFTHNSLIPCSIIFVKKNLDKNLKSKLGQALSSAKIGVARFKPIDPAEAKKMKDIFDYYSQLEINFKK